MPAKTNYALCFICQARPKSPETNGGLLCVECANPKHTHAWTETYRITAKTEEARDIIYYACECGENTMGQANA